LIFISFAENSDMKKEISAAHQAFRQYTAPEYTKRLLTQPVPLARTACAVVLSFTGRSYNLSVQIEKMTRNEEQNLTIRYRFASGLFGTILIASTPRGVCFLAFADDCDATLDDLCSRFPQAAFTEGDDTAQQQVLDLLEGRGEAPRTLRFHLRGTPFQFRVWEMLLSIPPGALVSYGNLAAALGVPGASRAAGSAVGANPISYLIPCHRVIRATGELGGYHWGITRKIALIGWETARTLHKEDEMQRCAK